MLLLIGYIIVLGSTLCGFMLAGGKPILLLHISEFVCIGGISVGVMVIASNADVLRSIFQDILACLKGGNDAKRQIMDLLKLLYELFMLSRRNGIIALDEHISDPYKSSILTKYPSILSKKELLDFIINAFRPIIDGRVKPEQIGSLLEMDIETKEDYAEQPVNVLSLIGDSLPGIGIVAAVLGIINTMNAIADGPEKVGMKVAAALTGTFLGVLGAYGFVNPLAKRIQTNHRVHFMLFRVAATAIRENAKGATPLVALEFARRQIDSCYQPDANTMEETLKESIKK